MINKHFSFILVIVLLGILSLIVPTVAQNATSTQRDALIAAIQEHAQQDVELEKVPENAQGIDLLFGEEAKSVGLTLREVVKVYDEAYQAAKPKKSGFEKFMENQLAVLGWGLAIIFFIFHFLREAMNQLVIHVVTSTKNWLYRRLAGYRFLRKIALRRYRQALIDKYQQIKIPFRPERPLEMQEIFVPLKVKGTRDIDQIDAYQAITKDKRLMVLGAPGAGKTMLLRYVALSYAEARLTGLPKQPVPILLELNRLNESNEPIQNQLVEMLGLNDFPNAQNFVEIGLEQGTLMLLFDGFDEVNTKERQRVVKQINDLLDTYKQCRAIISCRTAVYRNEFADKTEQTLEIVEFSDQQIQQFLVPWKKDMPPEKSIEQLIFALRDKPRIMALARNPLLLTIIAYLYSDTEFILPHSRAEFYSKATDVLLDQWKVERNHYKAAQKKLVLQHLALFNQDSGAIRKQDRRSIDLKTVLAQIKTVLPDLNLAEENVVPLLDEIVERSGLLLSIDGGERYQFAHLTLQEFFAAAALRDNAEELLRRFQDDPDIWRETVKLWCGLDHDSTDLIQGIYAADSVTGFECLADAQKVSAELADEMITVFKPQLGTAGEKGEAINQAFAAVAADIRPRGQAVLDFLANTLANATESERRIAAANTLSLTNLPKAAELLANCYVDRTEVRSALIRLGDLAVPKLEVLAQQGHLNALDDLQAIGTIQAAIKLVLFLWHEDNQLASRTALNLASLLPKSEIENTLREYPLTKEQRKADWWKWVWAPFNEPVNSSLPIIVGRIAHLINQVTEKGEVSFHSTLDPRIIIPLAVQVCSKPPIFLRDIVKNIDKLKLTEKFTTLLSELNKGEKINFDNLLEVYKAFRKVFDEVNDKKDTDTYETLKVQLMEESLKMVNASHLLNVLNFLKPEMQLKVFPRLIGDTSPTVNDWKNVFFPIKYKFDKGWHFILILLMVASISLVSLVKTTMNIFQSPTRAIWYGVLLVSIVGSKYLIWKKEVNHWNFVIRDPLEPLITIFPFVIIKRKEPGFDWKESTFISLCVWLPMAYFTTLVMLDLSFSWWAITGSWLTFALVITLLFFVGFRKEREAENPLHGILEPPSTTD